MLGNMTPNMRKGKTAFSLIPAAEDFPKTKGLLHESVLENSIMTKAMTATENCRTHQVPLHKIVLRNFTMTKAATETKSCEFITQHCFKETECLFHLLLGKMHVDYFAFARNYED